MILRLDLLTFKSHLKFKLEEDKKLVFDPVRKKWLVAGPEEIVRQLFLQYLHLEKNWPWHLISVEREMQLNSLKKRWDVLLFSDANTPLLLVECKRPEVKLDDSTLDQIRAYNSEMAVPYLSILNGEWICIYEKGDNAYSFVAELPEYSSNP